MQRTSAPRGLDEGFSSVTSLPITRDSDEWGAVEALLQIIFRSGNISLRSLWSVSNPGLLARFERRSRGSTGVIPTIIASEDLDASVSLNSVCDNGFPDLPGGLRVRVGNLSLPNGFLNGDADGSRMQGRGRRMFECFVVKAMIGKSLVAENVNCGEDDKLLVSDLPGDYDSILMRPQASDSQFQPLTVSSSEPASVAKGFLPPHTFCQTYILRNGSQVLPMFVCRFEVDTDKDEGLALPPCQNCESAPATIWCAADSASLCPECDEAHHSANKLTLRHIRVPINERPRDSGPCAVRNEQMSELWSEAMGVAVSRATQKEHFPTTNFADIKDAYRSSIRLARREDSDFERVKENLLSRLKAQDEALESVERMFKEAEETSYRKVADALTKTLALTENRTTILLEAEKRLQTRIQFLQWAEELLVPFAHELPPTDWLHLWLEHYRLVREFILTGREPPSENEGLQDIKIGGHLSVRDTHVRHF